MFEPRSVIDLAREPIRSSGRRYADDVSTRLDVSARHLRVADWGRSLEPAWDTNREELASMFPGLDGGVIITAAQTLVFASSVAALDSCASSLAFWCDYVHPSGRREVDVGGLVERRAKGTAPFEIPPWADDWLTSTMSDPRWTPTEDYRHRQLHRIVPRSVVVRPATVVMTLGNVDGRAVIQGESRPAQKASNDRQFGSTIDPDGPSVVETYDEVVEFAIERWTEFWTALAADA
jgi:hypothetical protein